MIRDGRTNSLSVLRENGYSTEQYRAKVVSSQHVIDHYKELNDEQELVFAVVEKILREHDREKAHA